MADFSSGVKRFIKAQATVTVFFPVDWRDNPEIACKHCNFFVRATQRCGLNQQIVNYPEKYIGDSCPLKAVADESETEEETNE